MAGKIIKGSIVLLCERLRVGGRQIDSGKLNRASARCKFYFGQQSKSPSRAAFNNHSSHCDYLHRIRAFVPFAVTNPISAINSNKASVVAERKPTRNCRNIPAPGKSGCVPLCMVPTPGSKLENNGEETP